MFAWISSMAKTYWMG